MNTQLTAVAVLVLLALLCLYTLSAKIPSLRRVRGLSFIRRNGLLLLLVGLSAFLALSDWIFQYLGPVIYLPILVLGAGAVATLFRNVFNHKTSDPYTDEEVETKTQYEEDFHNMTPKDKVWLTTIQFLVYFLGACIVAASIIKL